MKTILQHNPYIYNQNHTLRPDTQSTNITAIICWACINVSGLISGLSTLYDEWCIETPGSPSHQCLHMLPYYSKDKLSASFLLYYDPHSGQSHQLCTNPKNGEYLPEKSVLADLYQQRSSIISFLTYIHGQYPHSSIWLLHHLPALRRYIWRCELYIEQWHHRFHITLQVIFLSEDSALW